MPFPTSRFLGLDSSTQSLTALVLEADGFDPASTRIVYEKSLNFDREFPAYGTRNGALAGPENEVHAPPLLWVEALERLLSALRDEGVDLSRIRGIGVSGQQHGSVYLNDRADKTLATLDPARGLVEQVEPLLSRRTSPIWMDASTGRQCREITQALGGMAAVCALTGSAAFERFTGPQIRKFFAEDAAAYAATRHILLVSSFIPSLLGGRVMPIDPGDGAGMNLMDIGTRRWSEKALEATAPGLKEKLLPILPSSAIGASISPYFVRRFSFSPDCKILPGTGDNPSSLIGLGLVSSGRIGISLGTSDTLFAFLSRREGEAAKTDPSGQSHVFGSPTGDDMAISVYKNGSLAREAVRQAHALTWEEFSGLLEKTPAGNGGRIFLPYFDTEIIPKVTRPGVRRIGFREGDTAAEVRGVVEAQMTSMLLHSEWMGEKPSVIFVTGGASSNTSILRVMADVFGVPVYRQETTSAAALGAALRAFEALARMEGAEGGSWSAASGEKGEPSWEEIVGPFSPLRNPPAAVPDTGNHAALAAFKEKYRAAEKDYLASNG